MVLGVSGSVSNVYNAAEADTLVDMTVKVSIPDEALSELDATGAKFALAVDKVTEGNETRGKFKYWTGSGWNPVGVTNYVADSWVRVTMKFDYAAKKCSVALNGDPCATYDLLDKNAASLASLEIRGSTAIDEVLVTQDTMVAAFADSTTKKDNTVTYKWLTENNVTWEQDLTATTSDGSGYSYTQKYVFGLKPLDGKKCTLEFNQDNRDNKALLTFPGWGAYGGDGYYVLETKTGSGEWTVGAQPGYTRDNGVNEFLVSLPSEAGTAVRYRIMPALLPQSHMSVVSSLNNP